jgi:hypothetical protein
MLQRTLLRHPVVAGLRLRRPLCAAADASAAVLKSAASSADGPSLEALTALTSAMPPKRVSILMLLGSARDRSAAARLANARFVRGELTARRAHILSVLRSMPAPLSQQPAVATLCALYWERLRKLLENADIATDADLDAFVENMRVQNAKIVEETDGERQARAAALCTLILYAARTHARVRVPEPCTHVSERVRDADADADARLLPSVRSSSSTLSHRCSAS